MPAEGTTFFNKPIALGKHLSRGLYVPVETTVPVAVQDAAQFNTTTGSAGLPDLTFASGVVTLLEPAAVPSGMRLYITSLKLWVDPTAWSGGTGTNKSIVISDSAGTEICSFTQAALTSSTYYALPAAGVLATGVADSFIRAMQPCTAAGGGLKATVSNSTASGNVRISIAGYIAP